MNNRKITEEDLSTTDILKLGNMTYIQKDYTEQEELIASVLSEIGVRYDQQVRFSRSGKKNELSVDFYLPEINIVIEADGVFGHSKKANEKRDKELLELGVEEVVHISLDTRDEIKEELLRIFNHGY